MEHAFTRGVAYHLTPPEVEVVYLGLARLNEVESALAKCKSALEFWRAGIDCKQTPNALDRKTCQSAMDALHGVGY